jgi:diguanylate cyclase (GGDEF)-like protein
MKILIAEDDPVSRRVLVTQLTKWGHEVISTQSGQEAWQELSAPNAPHLAILDWMMPGMTGVEVCRKAREEIKDRPLYLIILTALCRKEYVIQGLEAGADDYLTKPFDVHELRVRLQAGERIVDLQLSLQERVSELEMAIVEREQAEKALRDMTLTDDMTGLYNHRGFFTLAEHQIKTAKRSKQNSVLLFADMDGLKQINDSLGHAVGSAAIAKTAAILRKTFRDCDIIARLGGDEFVVLAPNVEVEESHVLIQRLRDNLKAFNCEEGNEFELSLSIGAIALRHDCERSLDEYIGSADKAMYHEKRLKKGDSSQHSYTEDLSQGLLTHPTKSRQSEVV